MTAGELSAASARRLGRRRPAPVDPARGPAVKRNVHELLVDAPAAAFAAALEETLVEPGAVHAGLVLLRLPGRAGRPFELGERFQAAFRLPGPRRLGRWLEERVTSDFAEIDLLERGEPFRARYRYLEGAPLRGSSTLSVAPEGPRARFTVVFELQEVGALGVELLHRFGIRAHDAVVLAQAARAASRIPARIVASTLRQ